MARLGKRFSLSLSFLLLVLVLGACGGATPNEPNTPNPPPPVEEITALVVGEASSPFLDALAKKVRLVQSDGTQAVADHDLLVLDGDAHMPDEVAGHP